MDPDELKEILRLHAMWAKNEEGGSRAELSRANLIRAKLYHAYLAGANLSHANLSHANLFKADLFKADLSNAHMTGTSLDGANLSYAKLVGAFLSHAYLSHANLSDANLSHANLSHANLGGTNLSYANLSHDDLSLAELAGADLSGANLSDANLSHANLSHANLHGADLTGTDLRITDLRRIDFSEAKNLDKALLPADFSSITGIDLSGSTPREDPAPPTTDWETCPEFAEARKKMRARIDDPKTGPGTFRDRLVCLWLFSQTCDDLTRIGDQSRTARLMRERGSQGVTHTGVRTRLESLGKALGVDLTEPVHRPGCHEARRLTRHGVALREWLKLHPQYVS